MKAIMIRVGYGKNNTYVNTGWVLENAVDAYKKEWTEYLRGKGWKKDIIFTVINDDTRVDEENPNGSIIAYTLDGLRYVGTK